MQKILIPILGLFQSPQRTSQYFNIQNNYILVPEIISNPVLLVQLQFQHQLIVFF